MKTSITGISLIKQAEGFRATAYLCPAGVWTIGYGTTEGVTPGMLVSEAEAEMMLADHLNRIEMQLSALGLAINQNQFDALIDFIYNLGWGNFTGSTLLQLIRMNPNNPLIADEFVKWHFANHQPLPGLLIRRQAEAQLYFA